MNMQWIMQGITIVSAAFLVASEQADTAVDFQISSSVFDGSPLQFCASNGCIYDPLHLVAPVSNESCAARGLVPLKLTCSSSTFFDAWPNTTSQQVVEGAMARLGSYANCNLQPNGSLSVMMMVSIAFMMLGLSMRPMMEISAAVKVRLTPRVRLDS